MELPRGSAQNVNQSAEPEHSGDPARAPGRRL